MGLGKTLQTISFLGYLKHILHVKGTSLIIVPLSVLSNWMNEFRRFLPSFRVLKLHSSDSNERERMKKEDLVNMTEKYDCVITTYEMVKTAKMHHILVSSMHWRYVVLDEGHIIRNECTIIADTVRKMHFEHVLLLTGTPLQNNLHELWSLLNFLEPNIFSNSKVFDECFDIGAKDKYKIDQEMLLKVHHMLNPFLLRRIKSEVEKNIPLKIEKKVMCPLTQVQVHWYKTILMKDRSLFEQMKILGDDDDLLLNGSDSDEEDERKKEEELVKRRIDVKKLQAMYMQLRKCCNHPYLFANADPDPGFTDERIIEASGKLHVLDRLLIKLRANGHRVVIFSQFTSVLDILNDYLEYREIPFCRLDGQTNRVQRQIDINRYNAPNSHLFAFIMSTRAGGLGVNLQTADTVILYDSDWNPQSDLQAMARVHRIGQKKIVHVYRLVTEGTVEERIVQRAEKKLFLDQVVNRDSIRGIDQEEEISGSELLKTLRFGAHEICQSTGKSMSDEDIDVLIDRQDYDPSAGPSLMRTTSENIKTDQQFSAADFNPLIQPTNSRHFQGQIFEKRDPAKTFINCSSSMHNIDVSAQQEELGITEGVKRSRTSRLVTVTDSYGGSHNILSSNMYDLNTGEPSVYEREFSKKFGYEMASKDVKRKVQIAGRDYINEDHCLCCWDGGDLICCDFCPASYHQACLGLDAIPKSNMKWSCPHHACFTCGKKASAVGGLLFRCSECPNAYCEDHVPLDAVIVTKNRRYSVLGFKHPPQACYIYCSASCEEWSSALGGNDYTAPTFVPEAVEPKKKTIVQKVTKHPIIDPNDYVIEFASSHSSSSSEKKMNKKRKLTYQFTPPKNFTFINTKSEEDYKYWQNIALKLSSIIQTENVLQRGNTADEKLVACIKGLLLDWICLPGLRPPIVNLGNQIEYFGDGTLDPRQDPDDTKSMTLHGYVGHDHRPCCMQIGKIRSKFDFGLIDSPKHYTNLAIEELIKEKRLYLMAKDFTYKTLGNFSTEDIVTCFPSYFEDVVKYEEEESKICSNLEDMVLQIVCADNSNGKLAVNKVFEDLRFYVDQGECDAMNSRSQNASMNDLGLACYIPCKFLGLYGRTNLKTMKSHQMEYVNQLKNRGLVSVHSYFKVTCISRP